MTGGVGVTLSGGTDERRDVRGKAEKWAGLFDGWRVRITESVMVELSLWFVSNA